VAVGVDWLGGDEVGVVLLLAAEEGFPACAGGVVV